jgi:hypothetical protein
VVEAFVGVPGNAAVVLADWKVFGVLPMPGWGAAQLCNPSGQKKTLKERKKFEENSRDRRLLCPSIPVVRAVSKTLLR